MIKAKRLVPEKYRMIDTGETNKFLYFGKSRNMLAYAGKFAVPLLAAGLLLAGCTGENGPAKEENTVSEQQQTTEPAVNGTQEVDGAGNTEESKETLRRIGGKDVADSLLVGEYERMYAQFSDDLKKAVTLDQFRSMGKSFTANMTSFELTSDMRLNGYEHFVWANPEGTKGLSATLDDKSMIAGIQILELPAFPATDAAYSKTKFQPPFEGDWLVFWGGHNTFLNYHYEHEQVRYAYDLIVERDGFSYQGDPTKNESYFAFGQNVLAPADGVVVAVVDGIPDNEPVGQMNEAQPAGNMIIIRHENGEFSMIAHFKNGSIVVQEGDRLRAGQVIGQCGNSGNSSEAHIHFQVSPPSEVEDIATTIPVSFQSGAKPVRGNTLTGVKPSP
ncbi:M23 family metallopeptidase [Paenibacillus methanolicus]|uniref:Peptidase M23-like protein n=1 Tax=Paenibacillus methanolicus TaxID=582686 RepID=A0A5S5C3S2_9BACL|nr:M23 family metallopeptidase [Paenibacillus methanolicus]TYP74071.1 peptidase M23-like protein [Paenibacillus methanolicus]